MRCKLFPDVSLRPKHHYFEHYAELIERYGVLMRVSTLPFESKHPFFKTTITLKKCLKNVTKLLSNEHELMMSVLRSNHLVENSPLIPENAITDISDLTPEQLECLSTYFGDTVMRSMVLSNKATYRGTSYSKGTAIVIDSRNYCQLELCLIQIMCTVGRNCYAVGALS